MKKILIATLLAFGAATAHAQVTVSGKLSEWMDSNKVGSARSVKGVNTEPTSNLSFSVNENLGSGLIARGVIETSVLSGAPVQFGDRQGTVGIGHTFGSIDLGRNVHSQYLALANNDAFSTLHGSIAGDVHNLRGLRYGNGAFVTVTPMKDLAFSYDRSATGAVNETSSYSVAGSVLGINGTVARFNQGQEYTTVYGLNGKVGKTQLFYTHSLDRGVTPFHGDSLGVKQPFGKFTAKASYGKTNNGTKAYALGVDYAFSKRTEVGVTYRDANLAGVANDTKQIGVGLTHRF